MLGVRQELRQYGMELVRWLIGQRDFRRVFHSMNIFLHRNLYNWFNYIENIDICQGTDYEKV